MYVVHYSIQAEASDRPVVEQVLLADEVRRALLVEEASLLREMDAAEERDGNGGSFDSGMYCIKIIYVVYDVDTNSCMAALVRRYEKVVDRTTPRG